MQKFGEILGFLKADNIKVASTGERDAVQFGIG